MGKISEYIIELTETFGDLLDQHGNYGAAIDDMRDLLSKDEFEFFEAHLDVIEEKLGFTDGNEGVPMDEARGLKGDVLRPWGGRKARAKMGFGKGNRANFNPKDEVESEDDVAREQKIMQDIEDDRYVGPMTSTIIDGEEVFDIDEEYQMPPINEEFGLFQQTLLVVLAGAIAIGIINGKGSPEAAGWTMWMEKFFPALKRKRIGKQADAGLQDFAAGKIDLSALEEIIMQDERVKDAIESMKRGDKQAYSTLYSFIKRSMGKWSISETPGKKIKQEYFKQGDEYKAKLAAQKDDAKYALEMYGEGEGATDEVIWALEEFVNERGYKRMLDAFNALIADPATYRDFYSVIKSFFGKGRITETPAKKILARARRESKHFAKNNIKPGNPEDFDRKHAPQHESLFMPSLAEGWRDNPEYDDGEPDY